MFNINKVKAHADNETTKLIANVVRELGHMFDVLSKCIMTNKKDIIDFERTSNICPSSLTTLATSSVVALTSYAFLFSLNISHL